MGWSQQNSLLLASAWLLRLVVATNPWQAEGAGDFYLDPACVQRAKANVAARCGSPCSVQGLSCVVLCCTQ